MRSHWRTLKRRLTWTDFFFQNTVLPTWRTLWVGAWADAGSPPRRLFQYAGGEMMVAWTRVVAVEVGRSSWIPIYFKDRMSRICWLLKCGVGENERHQEQHQDRSQRKKWPIPKGIIWTYSWMNRILMVRKGSRRHEKLWGLNKQMPGVWESIVSFGIVSYSGVI